MDDELNVVLGYRLDSKLDFVVNMCRLIRTTSGLYELLNNSRRKIRLVDVLKILLTTLKFFPADFVFGVLGSVGKIRTN
jgi:hypothetical protein